MRFEILSKFHLPWLSAIALLVFFVFFITLLIRVYRPSAKAAYASFGAKPLEDAPYSLNHNEATHEQ